MEKIYICEINQVTSEKPFVKTISTSEQIVVYTSDSKFHAVENRCPHAGALLNDGEVEGVILTCMWHGWQFDLRNGRCLTDSWAKLKVYPVMIENNKIFVEIKKSGK